jgi:hypothetical protein
LVNWKAGQVRNGNRLLRYCIRLVTLLLLAAAAVALITAVAVAAVAY